MQAVLWEALIQAWADSHEMSYRDALKYMSKRSSLQVVAELLGVRFSKQFENRFWPQLQDIEALNDLAEILRKERLPVPEMFDTGPGNNPARRRKMYQALRDMQLVWYEEDVEDVVHMWKEGLAIHDIAKALDRDPDEVVLLAIDLARQGRIERRSGGVFGRRKVGA